MNPFLEEIEDDEDETQDDTVGSSQPMSQGFSRENLALRLQLQADVDAFLARGGVIEVVPAGARVTPDYEYVPDRGSDDDRLFNL